MKSLYATFYIRAKAARLGRLPTRTRARKVRIEFAGAMYHVLDRGGRREAIFRDDEDRERFLKTLGEACARTGWRVHAWTLMSNHYQLMVATPEANLVAGIPWFQTTLTIRYNCRHPQGEFAMIELLKIRA